MDSRSKPVCIICQSGDFSVLVNKIRDYEYGLSIADYSCIQCGNCGLIQLHPVPTLAELANFYPDSYGCYSVYDSYPRTLVELLIWFYHNTLLNYCSQFFRNGDTILEMGCAVGNFLNLVKAKFPQCRCMGIEINEKAAECARRRGFEVIVGSAEVVDVEEDSVDFVILNHLLEHSFNPVSVLRKINKCLKKGGYVHIETPDASCLSRKIFNKFWGGYHFPRHIYIFSRDNLKHFLNNVGFEVIKTKGTLNSFGWTFSVQNYLTELCNIKKVNGRAWFYGPLMLGLAPLIQVLNLFKQTDAFGITAIKASFDLLARKVKIGD